MPGLLAWAGALHGVGGGSRGDRQKEAEGACLLKNFNRETLTNHSFSVMNFPGASSVEGALLVISVLLLACLGYRVACYKDYVKRVENRI